MRLRISQPFVGTALSVVAAIAVTAQAMSAPRKPHKARDLVPASERAQAQFADVCQMYPAECRLNPDGSVARVLGLSRESVKARIHRARLLIREYLVRD